MNKFPQKRQHFREDNDLIIVFLTAEIHSEKGAWLREKLSNEKPRGPLARLLPSSQRSQGLPQAAPRVAQHSDFRVAPLMFTSQRLSWILSQHVPFRLSEKERKEWGAFISYTHQQHFLYY